MLKANTNSQYVNELILIKNSIRDPLRKDLIPTKRNIMELMTPWINLSKTNLSSPQRLKLKLALSAKLRCATELNATIRFKSLWTAAEILANIAPNKNQFRAILIFNQCIKIHLPNTPIFNKTPAKIILPKVGLSTWALGNHIWRP